MKCKSNKSSKALVNMHTVLLYNNHLSKYNNLDNNKLKF